MQGMPGEDGKAISDRMLADTKFTRHFKVIWDKHWANETPEQYIRELKPILDEAAKTGDFIVLSTIRQIAAPGPSVDIAKEQQITAAINRQLARLYPLNFLDVTSLLDPPSMREADGIHLSAAGNDAVAKALASAISARSSAVSP